MKTFEVGNSQQCKRLQLEIIMVHFASLGCEGCPEGCEYSNIQGLTSLTLCARRDALLYSSSNRILQVGHRHFSIQGGNDSPRDLPRLVSHLKYVRCPPLNSAVFSRLVWCCDCLSNSWTALSICFLQFYLSVLKTVWVLLELYRRPGYNVCRIVAKFGILTKKTVHMVF